MRVVVGSALLVQLLYMQATLKCLGRNTQSKPQALGCADGTSG
jgi:hypothetical protein